MATVHLAENYQNQVFLEMLSDTNLVNYKMLLSENYENNYSTEILIFFVYFERQYLHIFGLCFDQNSSRK